MIVNKIYQSKRFTNLNRWMLEKELFNQKSKKKKKRTDKYDNGNKNSNDNHKNNRNRK